MKNTLIAAFIFSMISSFLMVLFYFASVHIYHEYVNEKTLAYINSLYGSENLPKWTSMRGLWQELQIDYLIRFTFMVFIVGFIITLIYTTERPKISLYILLTLSLFSLLFMLVYFLASADIYNEYVNGNIGKLVHLSYKESLLVFPNCELEWTLTKIDFILRAIFMLSINLMLLKWILTKNKQFVPSK